MVERMGPTASEPFKKQFGWNLYRSSRGKPGKKQGKIYISPGFPHLTPPPLPRLAFVNPYYRIGPKSEFFYEIILLQSLQEQEGENLANRGKIDIFPRAPSSSPPPPGTGLCQPPLGAEAKFIVPDWGDKVELGIGLLYRSVRLHWLQGRAQCQHRVVHNWYLSTDIIPDSLYKIERFLKCLDLIFIHVICIND